MKRTRPTRLALFTLTSAAAALLLTGCLGTGTLHPYSNVGESMSPLLHEGDRIFVDQSPFIRSDLHDGDVIVFRHTNDAILIKRILAMPGETIGGDHRHVFRNGKLLDEPYLAPPTEDPPAPVDFPTRVVPPGELFVMGDNRDRSLDSRYPEDFGPVHLTEVLGRYTITYWHASRSK